MDVLFINLFPIDSRRFLVSLGSLAFFSIPLCFTRKQNSTSLSLSCQLLSAWIKSSRDRFKFLNPASIPSVICRSGGGPLVFASRSTFIWIGYEHTHLTLHNPQRQSLNKKNIFRIIWIWNYCPVVFVIQSIWAQGQLQMVLVGTLLLVVSMARLKLVNFPFLFTFKY